MEEEWLDEMDNLIEEITQEIEATDPHLYLVIVVRDGATRLRFGINKEEVRMVDLAVMERYLLRIVRKVNEMEIEGEWDSGGMP